MKILITGGAGFIGANFVHYLVNNYPDGQITVFDALTYSGNLKSLQDVKNKIKFVEGDITESNELNPLVEANDLVVNFAAESHNDNSIHTPENFINTNILGIYYLLEAVRKYDKRLHHISTDEVFGDMDINSVEGFTEMSRYNPSSPYSASKASSDMLVRAWVRSFGIKATITNCSNNYGPYQHVEKFIPRQITNLLTDRKIVLYGSGNNVRDWIHVADHVAGVWAAINKGKNGETYLLGANTPVSNKQVVTELLEIFGYDDNRIEIVADRPGHDRKYLIDSAKARRELGWRPNLINFRAGLESTVEWYKNHEAWWKNQKDATEANYQATQKSLEES